jgi:hypothetical protein
MKTTGKFKPWEQPIKRVHVCVKKKLKEYGPINPQ